VLESFDALKPYVFTYGGAQFFMGLATFLVLPLLYFKVIKKLTTSGTGRFVGLLATWALLWALVYGDVLLIARQAKALCQTEAVLHVYETAETDGFLGGAGIVGWVAYGFSYIENHVGGYRRLSLKDGQETRERVKNPISRYEYVTENKIIGRGIKQGRALIRDRTTGEILGQQTYFYVYPGWADRQFLRRTGLTFIPPICTAPNSPPRPGVGPDSQIFIKTILKPKKANGGAPD